MKYGTYRIEEIQAPDSFVKVGEEKKLVKDQEEIPLNEVTIGGKYEDAPRDSITITVDSNTAHEVEEETGKYIIVVEQPNDEAVGSLTLHKKGEILTDADKKEEQAFMLKLLNEHFQLNLSEDQLEIYAATLGADCAFFIRNAPTFAEGIGNIFSPIPLSLKGYQILIIKPDVFVSTREAFANIHPHHPEYSIKEAIKRPANEWKEILINDFEDSVFPQHPVIGEIKAELYRQGAVYASMSGSGSSVYGLFEPEGTLPETDWGTNVFRFKGRL